MNESRPLAVSVLTVAILVACVSGASRARASSHLAAQVPPFMVPISSAVTAPVSIAEPTSGTVYVAPATIGLTALLSGDFTQVDFYGDNALIGTARSAPFEIEWSGVPSGIHTLTAVGRTVHGTPTYSAPVQVEVKTLQAFPLIQEGSLHYEGAFRLPSGTFGSSNFGYAGPIAYNPGRNSLFMVGHTWHQLVAEIGIPELRTATTSSDYAQAPVLQSFGDPADGRKALTDPGESNQIMVGGLLVDDDQLVTSIYSYYDGSANAQFSHFVSGLDLADTTDAQGPFKLNNPGGVAFANGYMTHIPSAWRELLGGTSLVGQCCIAVTSRTSQGPALFAFTPEQLGPTPADVAPLAYYTVAHPLGTWGGNTPVFNGTSKITGVVFPEGTRSVLLFGRHGTGPFCYGDGATCGDPESEYTGVHGYPYVYRVWAFDVSDLIDVRNGVKAPWDIQPYHYWELDLPQRGWQTIVHGATYDPSSGRIYVSQGFVDGARPVVHAFTLNLP